MEKNEALDLLYKLFKNEPWFYDVGTDQFGRYVVYVTTMSLDIMSSIPDTFNGKQVLCHFSSVKEANLNKFVNKVSLSSSRQNNNFEFVINTDIKAIDVLEELEEPVSLIELEAELDSLEKICGPHSLQEIFFEIHDGKNSVTNLSARYPEVRVGMEKLYNEYGFDIMYENLDG